MADEATATADTTEAPAVPEAGKLTQNVEVSDVGPCKKHIKVTVDRKPIEQRYDEKFTELVKDSSTPINGFRPGKAPRKVIERRFGKDVHSQVKTEVLMASLEQLATENKITPLAPPDIDPGKLDIPNEGPFVYEFDVEVQPEFDLPNYKGLKLKRPVRTFSDADVARERKRLMEEYGQLVPKAEGRLVELDDVIVADVVMKFGDKVLNEVKETRFRVDRRLSLADGVAEHFAKELKGAKVGDKVDVVIKLSDTVATPALRGQSVIATFDIKDLKTVREPELTEEILGEFGVRTADQLDELVRTALDRRLEYLQRQAARQQVLGKINEASSWELPQDLLLRQSRQALARRVMEMRSSGMSDQQIVARQRLLQQDVIQSTALALKEHFVLQKIAEVEKIEVNDEDMDAEIERIADRAEESPRRLRARLEKEDLLDTLAADLLERKALDLVLSTAEYEDVPADPDEDEDVATVTTQAVPGLPSDMAAEAVADKTEEN